MIVLSQMYRVVQLLIGVYTCSAIVFTTHRLVAVSLRSHFPHAPPWSFFPPLTDMAASESKSNGSKNSNPLLNGFPKSYVYLNLSTHSATTSGPEMLAMDENILLSKLFSNSLRPSKIIPFYYRATGPIDREDITVTTIVTSNRFKVFAQLVERYKGPISVTIHVPNTTTSEIRLFLDSLHALYASSPSMSLRVDIHVIIDSFERQLNTWRNIARLFSRTNYIMMLDVDFSICTDFRTAVRSSEAVMAKLRAGMMALVVPAFEFANHTEGLDVARFPRDKKSIFSLAKDKKIRSFHSFWQPGHNSTDYPRLYASHPGEVYKVTQYQSAYEPYVIFRKDTAPWCDERFVGYGGNKAACLFEMYLSGISFYVLSDHFIIHQNHLYEEVVREKERKINRKVYADFKEETCLRYLKSYHESGILNTARGYNVQEECKKVGGVSKVAARFIDTR